MSEAMMFGADFDQVVRTTIRADIVHQLVMSRMMNLVSYICGLGILMLIVEDFSAKIRNMKKIIGIFTV
jgi:hypothetical protein